MRILIVEDDPDILETLDHVLSGCLQHDCFLAKSADIGRILLKEANPDVMLLDLLMPGEPPTNLIELSRELYPEKSPRIILISAIQGLEIIANHHKVEYIRKPFNIEQLCDKLEEDIS